MQLASAGLWPKAANENQYRRRGAGAGGGKSGWRRAKSGGGWLAAISLFLLSRRTKKSEGRETSPSLHARGVAAAEAALLAMKLLRLTQSSGKTRRGVKSQALSEERGKRRAAAAAAGGQRPATAQV